MKPIFVLEGRAPTLKHNTIARRRQQATKGSQESKCNNGNRGRLTGLQKKVDSFLMVCTILELA